MNGSPAVVATTAPDPFPAWLRAELAARGWSQTDLAHRMGLAGSGTVSKWATGRQLPSPDARAALAAALSIDLGAVPQLPLVPRPPSPFGPWLDRRLAERNLTHAAFGSLAGVAQSTVTRWIGGRQAPTADGIARVAAVLGIDVSDVPGGPIQ